MQHTKEGNRISNINIDYYFNLLSRRMFEQRESGPQNWFFFFIKGKLAINHSNLVFSCSIFPKAFHCEKNPFCSFATTWFYKHVFNYFQGDESRVLKWKLPVDGVCIYSVLLGYFIVFHVFSVNNGANVSNGFFICADTCH